ncbi:MAG TPA: hypothetical protein PKK15_02140 [Kouleothrix sp.]|nr:hypothetical protein [Kouleothrix sp.]
MQLTQRLLVTLGVVALLLLSISAVAAQGSAAPQLADTHATPRPNEPPRLAWTPGRFTQALAPGQSVQLTASFVSNVALSDVVVRVSGDVAKITTPSSTQFANIAAGVPTTLVFTISMPASRAQAQAGVVQVLSRQRVLGEPLQLIVSVRKDTDRTPAPTPTRKPEPTRKPTATRKPEPTRRPEPTRKPTSPAYPAPLPH